MYHGSPRPKKCFFFFFFFFLTVEPPVFLHESTPKKKYMDGCLAYPKGLRMFFGVLQGGFRTSLGT